MHNIQCFWLLTYVPRAVDNTWLSVQNTACRGREIKKRKKNWERETMPTVTGGVTLTFLGSYKWNTPHHCTASAWNIWTASDHIELAAFPHSEGGGGRERGLIQSGDKSHWPGFVDGALVFLLQLPHAADAGVVIGRRLLVLGLAARPRLLGLHHLKPARGVRWITESKRELERSRCDRCNGLSPVTCRFIQRTSARGRYFIKSLSLSCASIPVLTLSPRTFPSGHAPAFHLILHLNTLK